MGLADRRERATHLRAPVAAPIVSRLRLARVRASTPAQKPPTIAAAANLNFALTEIAKRSRAPADRASSWCLGRPGR